MVQNMAKHVAKSSYKEQKRTGNPLGIGIGKLCDFGGINNHFNKIEMERVKRFELSTSSLARKVTR